MARYAALGQTLGMILMIFGLSILLPLSVSHLLDDGAELAYDETLVVTFGAGAALWLLARGREAELQIRDGFLLVALVWTVLPAFATVPLLLYLPNLSFTDAYFETVSGLTTSGATTLSDLDRLPPSINLWRAQLVWMGGMGVVVLAVAILPLLGAGGAQVFKAETPGPMKDTKLTPRITETAKGLWVIYFFLTVACILALKLAGMTWLDALIHAFSTLGLGGFSSHDASFGFWDSPLIEAVTIVFMLIASLNFATHFRAWRRRSVAAYARDPEAGMVMLAMLGSAAMIAVYLWYEDFYPSFWTSLRYAAFNVVSVASTTGFATTDFGAWPVFAPLWMLYLSCFAASSGSTGGGMKMIRALVLLKQSVREFTRILHPRAEVPLKVGGQRVEPNLIFGVLAFMLVYGLTIVGMSLAMTATGLDFVTAFSAVVACINNMGPGLNKVGPGTTYAVLSDFQTWLCIVAMLLGRLELFTLLVVFTPAFWRK
ncbi:MAG: TrkH family potassium uptake protein [Burkholderiales bacterium]